MPLLGYIANVQSTALVTLLILLAFSGLILALAAADAHDRLVSGARDAGSADDRRQGD